MKLRTTGRVAIAGLAVVAALGLSACSDDKGTTTTAAKTTTSVKTSATSAANLPPVPTVAELNAQLNTALDPSIPNEQKLEFVQGAQADPELPNRLAQAAKDANVQVQVTEVTSFGDSVNAKANFTLNGQTNVVDVPFVAEDGKWKVQKSWACTMLTNLGQQSTACA
ncbi:hypothetical protein ACWEVD_21160 [Nocardia thailandica]|uniref:Low molecular weight antigen MTB12-like C-terminal domain-containing protein n=1 Tax=Nocardia thailandica TaxID=257275 RepID=A0ABW6PPV6_9NOCA|nr:hypothetical protein [Nocardia thailandica]